MQSAVDDVVLGHGSPLVAAEAAYLALTAAPTTDTDSSTIPTSSTSGSDTSTSGTSVTASTAVPSTETVTSTVTSTGTTTATVTASGLPGTTVTVTAPTTITVTPSTSASPSTTGTTTSPTTPVATGPTGAEVVRCQTAIKLVLDNQTAVASAEKNQSANLLALDAAITTLAATTGTTTGSGGATGNGRTGAGAGSSTGAASGRGSTTAPATTAAAGSASSGSGRSASGGSGSGRGGAAAGAGSNAAPPSTGAAGSRTGSASGTAASSASSRPGSGSGTGGNGSGSATGNTGGTGNTGNTVGTGTGTGTGGGAGNGGGGGAGATPRVPTAADIAADQAQLDLDQANIAVAAQALTTATLTSPIAGTVAAVAITKGGHVTANSTSSVVTILGPGRYEVSTTIGLSLIDQLKVGDQASVAVNGVTTPLPGKVTMIGVLSSSATSGSVTYPVTVLLDPVSQKLYQGSGASVDITLSEVSNVLTVPTSAVHTAGSQHTVSVLTNGRSSSVLVQVGAVGTDLTQITSGISAGQGVVIADLDQPITSPTTSAAGGLSNLGGNANTGRTRGAGGAGGFNRPAG